MMVNNIKQVEILAEKECWCLLMRKFESIFLSFKTDMLCDKQYSYSTETVVMCLYLTVALRTNLGSQKDVSTDEI